MKELLGSEYPAYEASLSDPVCSGLQIDRLKLSRLDWNQICLFLNRFPGQKTDFIMGRRTVLPDIPYYYAGLYCSLQDPARHDTGQPSSSRGSGCWICVLLPGGKATELGARLEGKGLLWANDISNSRAKALLKNLELRGLETAV